MNEHRRKLRFFVLILFLIYMMYIMICKSHCLLSLIFVVGTLWFYSRIGLDESSKTFVNLLHDTQKKQYTDIVNERYIIATHGYLLGFALSLVTLVFYRWKNIEISKSFYICTVVAITFIVQYFYYILTPKTKWMLETNMNKRQIEAWLRIYKNNQWNYHFGILLGLISAAFLGLGFCKKN